MSSHPSNANDVFAKPKRPVDFHRPPLQTRGHDMTAGKQRKYLQLKEKIIGTDKLIQKFRQKAQECEEYKQQLKEVQTKLSIEEKGRMGLLAELGVLHQESKSFKSEKAASLAKIERLQLSVKEEEMVREQLVAQLSTLKRDKNTSCKLKEELAVTKLEMEKYRRMYQKTKQELDACKAGQRVRQRRTSEANSLPAPLISPPLSEAGLSPRSTCSLPLPTTLTLPHLVTDSPPATLVIKEEPNPITAQPPQQLDVRSGFDPNADLAIIDDGGSMDITKVDFLDCDSCDIVVKENSSAVDGDSDVILKNNDIVDKTNGSTTVQYQSLIKVSHLSDDSDSDSGSENEQMECEIPSPRPKMPSDLDHQKVPDTGDKTPRHPQLSSCSGVPVETTLLAAATSINKSTTSSIESNGELNLVNGCKSEEQKTSLSQELFGDFDDNLSHLSVSDSSSCCSQSSLGSVDDLADLLRSDTQLYNADDILPMDNNNANSNTVDGDNDDSVTEVGADAEDTQLYNNSDSLQDSGTIVNGGTMVNGNAIGEGAGTDNLDLVRDGIAGKKLEMDKTFVNVENKSTSEADNDVAQTPDLSRENQEVPSLPCGGDQKELNTISVATQDINHHQKSDASELRNRTQTPPVMVSVSDTETGVVTTVCEGPTVFLPRIEVEAAPADTASGEDSDCEMDVSFSTLFGDEFQAISPLPPSPFNSHVCRCPSTPLSPLPPSPVKRQPLSPLPQTPHKDLKSISPLPPSPISTRPAAISPIPPTPVTLNRAHHEGSSVDSTSSEEVGRDSDTSPVQFDDAAPVNVHVPKPCNLSITIHAASELVSSNDVIVSPIMIGSTESPSPKKGKLCVSETSPFSPLTFVLPSEPVEAVSVFDNTQETTPTKTVPITSESSSSQLRLSSTTAEPVSSDCTPITANSGTLSGACAREASPISPIANLAPASDKTAREAATAMSSTDGDSNLTDANVGDELAGTTSLDTHVEEGIKGKSHEVIKVEENPDNLFNGSLGLNSSSTDLVTKLDEATLVTQTTSSAEHPNIKSEKKDKDDEFVELFGDLDGSDLDLLDGHRPASDLSPAVPLPSGGCRSNKSPVEEGEVEDSSDEEGDNNEIVPPPIVKNNNQSLPMQISDLPLALSQQRKTAAVSTQPRSCALRPQVPSLAINRTSTTINRSIQEEGGNSPAAMKTTFDDLLNTFCPKTRSGKITTATHKATAKTTDVPTPLVRILSSARSKPKRRSSNQATKPNAAAFIGVQSASSAGGSSQPRCSEKVSCFPAAGKGQEGNLHVLESRVNGNRGKRSIPKRFEGAVSTEGPASKRQKLVSDDSQSSENGASREEGDKDKELGAVNSLPEATSPLNLPGYQLRTRRVLKSFVRPMTKRRTSGGGGGASGVGGGSEEQGLPPTKKRKKRTSSVAACGSPEAKKKRTIELESDDDGRVIEGVTLVVDSKLPHSSEITSNKPIVIKEDSTTTDLSNTVHTENSIQPEQTSVHMDNKKPNSQSIHAHYDATVTDAGLSSSGPPSSITPLPTTTSILADSSHLDTSSDAGDSDQPLMIGELESLLDGGEVFEDDEGSILSKSSKPSSEETQRPPPKPQVRKTDSATGQEEDHTPASSPKTGPDTISKHVQCFGEPRNKSTLNTSTFPTTQVPPLSSPSPHQQVGPISLLPTASTQSEAVGYGQPQQTPLPEYKPHNSSTSLETNTPQGSKNADPCPSSLSLVNNLDNNDDIFNSSLPIIEKPKVIPTQATTQITAAVGQHSGAIGTARAGGTSHQQHGGGGHPGISLAQNALTQCMKSPLPLPQWLVAAMTRVQSKHEHCAASGASLSKKKRGSAKEPIMRQRSQKIVDYILVNLERLVCGHLHLSTVLTMFTNPHNVPSLQDFVNATMKYLLTRYNPKIEHVVAVFHTQCDDVRGNPQQMCPLDGEFPPALLRPECQLIGLFLQMSQLYPSSAMAPLLVEMNKALYQAMLKPTLKFHKLSALGRVLTAICRLQGDADRVLFLAFDLLKKPLTINELAVMAGLASVWPLPLARRRGLKLFDNHHTLLLKGLEQQPLSYTLEVLVMTMMQSGESKGHGNLPANLYTLCQWGKGSKPKIPLLTGSLIKLLQTSDGVYIVSPPRAAATMATSPTPWHRPRPSVLAFHIVHCLRAIAHYQGWVWTNDTLIRAHLWPLLQEWNSNQDAVREAAVVCAVRLIGFISQQGLTHDSASSSVGQLQRVFIALLNKSDKISFPVQLAAVDSLIELCPPGNPRTQELVGVVKAWLKRQSGKPHGAVLCNELGPRLQALTVT